MESTTSPAETIVVSLRANALRRTPCARSWKEARSAARPLGVCLSKRASSDQTFNAVAYSTLMLRSRIIRICDTHSFIQLHMYRKMRFKDGALVVHKQSICVIEGGFQARDV